MQMKCSHKSIQRGKTELKFLLFKRFSIEEKVGKKTRHLCVSLLQDSQQPPDSQKFTNTKRAEETNNNVFENKVCWQCLMSTNKRMKTKIIINIVQLNLLVKHTNI